jgi:hypothetical protein
MKTITKHVVTGRGEVVGAELVRNPDVAKISFTGSVAVGKSIMRDGAATMKRVTLELGGKSPNILLDDADLKKAIPNAVVIAFLNSGQACVAGTRLSTDAYAADLKREFDVLYEEGEHRRRMMSVSAHDRIAGRPARMRVLEDFIQYAQSHPGVTFMRKVDIANYAIASTRTVRDGI